MSARTAALNNTVREALRQVGIASGTLARVLVQLHPELEKTRAALSKASADLDISSSRDADIAKLIIAADEKIRSFEKDVDLCANSMLAAIHKLLTQLREERLRHDRPTDPA